MDDRQDGSKDEAFDPALIATVRLAMVPGVGPTTRRALIEVFGSAEEILAAPPSRLREVPGVGVTLARRIVTACDEIDVETQLELCRRSGVTLLTEQSSQYPRLLREIHDPPAILFVRGSLLPEDALSVAIVGTRHCSHYGRQTAERLAAGLARAGLTIVSGLARGIDAVAHQGAMKAGGRTLAILGSGVLNVYPPEHVELAAQVYAAGAVISENPPTSEPMTGSFPQRNRVITGMTLGVIVVEAGERSGALISARHAMEQGREVFAVPGRVDSRMSRGCHRLIRDGAKLVETVEDVLEELGPLVEATPQADGRVIHHPAELQLNDQERLVLEAIDTEPISIDAVAITSGLPIQRVLATLSVLEMRHLVRRVSGNLVIRK
jgi:DNA processing protein